MSLASPFSISIVAITALAFLGLPIGHAMICGSILYLALAGLDMGTAAEQFLNGMYVNYIILAVPLFILAAELMNIGSMTDRLMAFCNAIVGRFRGGLAYVNIVQSIIFAGMSGSAIADLAGTGRVMIDMMTREGRYTRSYAAAITAASAVIGPIIPPSIPMVLFALVSDASIGFLFMGGLLPGLLMALASCPRALTQIVPAPSGFTYTRGARGCSRRQDAASSWRGSGSCPSRRPNGFSAARAS